MSLIINTNVNALVAQNNLNNTENNLSTAMTDLSSGMRINSAADDAAGYAITQDLTSQVNGLGQATNNAQDATSLVQTADGALNSVGQMLQRVSELAVEYNGGTLSKTDQSDISAEVNQLVSEINQIGSQAQFNGISLFPTSAKTLTFQVGADDGETISVALTSLNSSTGMLANLGSLSLGSSTILSTINHMIDAVSSEAATLGAVQNRLSYQLDNLSSYSENLTAAQSTIQDVDMASEETEFTKDNILSQAGIAMLSQAEQSPQQILKLLG